MRKLLIMAACLGGASAIMSCRPEQAPDRGMPDTLPAQSSPDSMGASEGTGAARSGHATLGRYRLDSRPDVVLTLPSPLREISGIAFSPDGRLFAHNDERGTVCEIDTSTGEIVRQFAVGERRLREDLEDIAVAGGTIYLVNSGGRLFSFSEGRDGENVPYTSLPTGLGPKNDVEGLCHDPETGALLLACKGDPGTGAAGTRAVYAFDLNTRGLLPSPRFVIDLDDLRRRYGLEDFMPSAIGRHPSGNFFVLSSVGNSLIELSPGGALLSYADLPGKYHSQPEGIAFDGGKRLFIANEGARKGKIAVYDFSGE